MLLNQAEIMFIFYQNDYLKRDVLPSYSNVNLFVSDIKSNFLTFVKHAAVRNKKI